MKLEPPSLLIEAMMSVFKVGVATFSSNTTIRDVVGTVPAANAFETNVVNFLFEKLGIDTIYSLIGLLVFVLPTGCFFVYIVYYRYVKKKRYIKLYWKYRNYKINRYFKGWMLFLIIPLCIFIPIILKQFYLLIELIFNVDLI